MLREAEKGKGVFEVKRQESARRVLGGVRTYYWVAISSSCSSMIGDKIWSTS